MPDTLYRRPLPAALLPFSSPEGKVVFQQAFAAGGLDGDFPLAEQFPAEPAFCGLGSLVVALNAVSRQLPSSESVAALACTLAALAQYIELRPPARPLPPKPSRSPAPRYGPPPPSMPWPASTHSTPNPSCSCSGPSPTASPPPAPPPRRARAHPRPPPYPPPSPDRARTQQAQTPLRNDGTETTNAVTTGADSSVVERRLYTADVGGSIPSPPTSKVH
jgi:hypothetical protein